MQQFKYFERAMYNVSHFFNHANFLMGPFDLKLYFFLDNSSYFQYNIQYLIKIHTHLIYPSHRIPHILLKNREKLRDLTFYTFMNICARMDPYNPLVVFYVSFSQRSIFASLYCYTCKF